MKSRMLIVTITAAAGLLLVPGARGHHGWAAFDPEASVTMKGTVTEFHFFNPHSVVEFDVKDEKGEVQKWQGEMTSSIRLRTKGWTPTSLETGDEMTVTGHPARNGSRVIRIMKIAAKGQDLKVDLGN